MADSFVQVPPDSTGKQVDAASLPVNGLTVLRQRVVLGDNSATAQFATVTNGALMVTGTVSLGAGTALIGAVSNAAGTALMGAVSLAAGTANIGFINNISAPVVLGAGAANIGTINNISAAVAVTLPANIGTVNNISAAVVLAAGAANIGSINNISATIAAVLAAGTANIGAVSNAAGTALMGAVSLAAGTANIGFINNISATVIVAGIVSLGAGTNLIGAVSVAAGTALMGAVSLAAGTANIGFINNISATVGVAFMVGLSARATLANATIASPWIDRFGRPIVQLNHPSLLATASQGPRCVVVSTSVTTALVAAPGAGLSIFVTMIAGTNGSATLTRGDVYQLSATASCAAKMYLAASGGGFVMKYDPPIQILSNTALNARVKPNVSEVVFNIHFYVGPK